MSWGEKNVIDEKLIILDSSLSSKSELLHYLAEQTKELQYLDNVENYLDTVDEREKEFSTAIGHSVSIPHGKSQEVLHPFICFIRTMKKITWDQMGNEVNLIFLLGIPEEQKGTLHLKILAEISKKLLDEDFREQLAVGDKEIILKQLFQVENNVINY